MWGSSQQPAAPGQPAGHHETAYGWTPNGVPSLAASPSYSARVSHPAALPLPAYLPQHHHQPGFLSHEVLSGNENVKRWRRGSWAAEGAGPAPRLSTGATSPHLYRQSLAHAPPNPTYSSGHLPVNPPVDHRRLSAAAAQHHFRVAASTTAHRRSSLVHRRPSLLGPPAPTTALHSAHAAEPPSPQTHNVGARGSEHSRSTSAPPPDTASQPGMARPRLSRHPGIGMDEESDVVHHSPVVARREPSAAASKGPFTAPARNISPPQRQPSIREACITNQVTANLSIKLRDLVASTALKKPQSDTQFPVETLKAYFSEFAIPEPGKEDTLGSIGLVEFKTIAGLLNLDHTEEEIEKIFRVVYTENKTRRDSQIDFHDYIKGINRGAFLKLVMGDPGEVEKFDIPSTFDYSMSTNDNYKNPDLTEFKGDFAAIRATLDYTYHVNYTPERQRWQDSVIKSVVTRTHPQTQPWIVYTCGPMGAGKGYTLSWMSTRGTFPLENIVHIDPDYFKTVMTEWGGYINASKENPDIAPGTMCHRESAYMQEIAQEAALENSQNIWVDGSLRDGRWFKKVFTNLRERFPTYRIGIFYVYSSEEIIRKRVASRAANTGRGVPEEALKESLDAPDKSLGILMPLVDFVARISNDESTPQLTAFESVDRTGTWLSIQRRFAKTQASRVEFPKRLSPLFLSRANFPIHAMIMTPETKRQFQNFSCRDSHTVDVRTAELVRKIDDLNFCKPPPETLTLTMSPAFPVNVDTETRSLAEIPDSAFSFAFCYGIANIRSLLSLKTVVHASPSLSLLIHGGFVYFDLKQNVVAVTAVRSKQTKTLLHFGVCTELTSDQVRTMNEVMSGRFQVCTLPFMVAKGCTEYAFVCPGETFGSDVQNYLGGFAYRFRKGSQFRDRIFAIVSPI